MFGVYLSQGIYWNSDTSPLLGDGFHQYVIFDLNLRNILHGSDSLLSSMPDAVYLSTLLKFGLIGLSTFFSLSKLFKNIPTPLRLALSTSYALMSFTVSQLEIKTWLDVFILIPLILTGLHLLIMEKKRILYFTSLSILFIQNYYFGYMTALFLVVWYFCQLSYILSLIFS